MPESLLLLISFFYFYFKLKIYFLRDLALACSNAQENGRLVVNIVKEAGGRLSDFSGENDFPSNGLIATNTLLHDNMLSYFKS